MAKQIYSFSQLCQEDQVALLKGGCIELMVLRSVMNYDTEKQTWQVIVRVFRRNWMKYCNPDSGLFLPQSREQWRPEGGFPARGQLVRGASQVGFCAIFMSSGDIIMFVLGLPHHFAAFGKMMKISSYFSLQSLCSPLTGQTPCITMLSKKSRFEELQLNTQNLQKHFFSQDGYFYLLQRYLQTKFAGCQAQEIFLTLTGKLLELHRLNDAHTKVNHEK